MREVQHWAWHCPKKALHETALCVCPHSAQRRRVLCRLAVVGAVRGVHALGRRARGVEHDGFLLPPTLGPRAAAGACSWTLGYLVY